MDGRISESVTVLYPVRDHFKKLGYMETTRGYSLSSAEGLHHLVPKYNTFFFRPLLSLLLIRPDFYMTSYIVRTTRHSPFHVVYHYPIGGILTYVASGS